MSEVVIADLLEARAAAVPDRVFAVFEDDAEWTYAETARQAWRLAASLRALGVRRRELVVSWLPNGPEALAAWFGANAAGCVYTPLNTGYKGRLLENALNLLEAELLLAHVELVPRLQGLDLRHLRRVVVYEAGAVDAPPQLEVIRWDDFLLDDAPHDPPRLDEPVEAWEDCTILFTSGTTGASKAVRRPYALYDCMGEVAFDKPGIGPDDRFFVCAPMFHGGADVPVYAMLRAGGSVAIVQGFRTDTFWDEVRRLGCTVAWIHSAMSIFLAKAPRREDDGDNPLRLAMLAPMFAGMRDFAERFGLRLYSVYGMTETPPPFCVVDPTDHRSLGPPNRGFEARLADEHDYDVGTGVAGELLLRHERPWVLTPGYYNRPDATESLWRNGWLHTGDVFVRDENGAYALVDRVKDSIRRRGENVSSFEVELEIVEHPAVFEAAVFGVPSELEEDVMAAVVLQPGARLEPAELLEFLRDRVPYYSLPRYVEFLDALPRTPSVRVDKTELRRRGVTDATWDRESAGVRVKRERLSR